MNPNTVMKFRIYLHILLGLLLIYELLPTSRLNKWFSNSNQHVKQKSNHSVGEQSDDVGETLSEDFSQQPSKEDVQTQ